METFGHFAGPGRQLDDRSRRTSNHCRDSDSYQDCHGGSLVSTVQDRDGLTVGGKPAAPGQPAVARPYADGTTESVPGRAAA